MMGLVNTQFLVGSTVVNSWQLKEAYKFWSYQDANGCARRLYWVSIWHLPLLLVEALITKGVWDRLWRSGGQEIEEDEEMEFDDVKEEIKEEKKKRMVIKDG